MDEDEFEQEMLLRQAKLLFPDVEEWILKMAIKAHINLGDGTFDNNPEKAEEIKSGYFQDTEYRFSE